MSNRYERRVRRLRRWYKANRNAEDNFKLPKAYAILFVVSAVFLAIMTFAAESSEAKALTFCVPMVIILALSRNILGALAKLFRAVTGPMAVRYKRAKRNLEESYYEEGTSRATGFGQEKEPTVGLRYFILKEEGKDQYSARFL